MELNFDEILKWIGALIVSIGGTSVIIIALSKWFGNILANKLLEKDKAKYQKDIEGIKSKYQMILENKKVELENIKVSMLRYSENQFSLYNELWHSLVDLKGKGDDLWNHANLQNLKSFSTQLSKTKTSIEKSRLLIEEDHYNSLKEVIYKFSDFQIGKLSLINVRNKSNSDLSGYGIDEYSINELINHNRNLKDEYSELLEGLVVDFRKQIKGNILEMAR